MFQTETTCKCTCAHTRVGHRSELGIHDFTTAVQEPEAASTNVKKEKSKASKKGKPSKAKKEDQGDESEGDEEDRKDKNSSEMVASSPDNVRCVFYFASFADTSRRCCAASGLVSHTECDCDATERTFLWCN
jgi:hypothetical protein